VSNSTSKSTYLASLDSIYILVFFLSSYFAGVLVFVFLSASLSIYSLES